MNKPKRRRRLKAENSEMWFTNYSEASSLPTPLAFIIIEIGSRGSLTHQDAFEAAKAVVSAHHIYPDTEIQISIDGYDDDSRELWDIKETRDYVIEVWTNVININGDMKMKLHESTYTLLGLCVGSLRVVRREGREYILEVV